MDVFISYTHDTAPLARRLRTDLQAAGLSVRMVDDRVQPGDSWAEHVRRGIMEARNIIVVLSRAGAGSSALMSEIALAVAAREASPSKRLIPALSDSEVEMPFFLKRFQALEMATERNYAMGIARLIQTLREPRLPEVGTAPEPAEIDLLRAGERALKSEAEAWELGRLSDAARLVAQLSGVLTAIAMAVMLVLILQSTGLFQGILANPVIAGMIGALAAFFAPQAVKKLHEIFARIFETSKEGNQ